MNPELETKKYIVVRNVLSEDLLQIFNNYCLIKFTIQKDYISSIGRFSGVNDSVQPCSIFDYSDPMTESLMINLLPWIREHTKIKTLEPTYSYIRFYESGQWLEKHTDRPSCQYSITLPLMSYDDTPWSIHLKESSDEGAEEVSVDLNLGDMLIYKGCETKHWREPFQGLYQTQAHLHYIDDSIEAYQPYKYDGRDSLGSRER